MNNNLVVSNQEAWPIAPSEPVVIRGQRRYTAANLLDFATLVRVLMHWRWLILGAIGAGFALALIKTLLSTPEYRASVTLEANPPTFSVSKDQSGDAQPSDIGGVDFVATQVGLLSSKSVAERTAQELNLANNPDVVSQDMEASARLRAATGVVEGGLKVTPPEVGQLITFTYDSPSPSLAASIANGIADSFINSALQRRYEASAYARNFLERQINKTRGDLERSERELVAYAQKEGIINTSTGPDGKPSGDTGSLQGESLVALNQALAAATARRVAAEGAYRGSQSTGPTSDVTQATATLRQQQAQLQAEYQQKRQFMKPDHPEMQSLQAQIDELGRQIARESSSMESGHNNTLLADYKAALAAESALQSRVAGLKGSVLNLRGRSIQYNILQREVDTNRSLYDALLQRFKEIGVAGGVGTAPVSVVDRADPPLLPFKPNLLFNLLMGLGGGLLAGVGAAVGLEFANDTIKSREDVRAKLSLACLGTVPKSAAKDEFVDSLADPTSIVSDAYSAIVAALRYSTDEGMPKVLVVTSSQSGEGKSSSALAIAQNLSRRDNRVLLIDSDLRKPAFKVDNDQVGLSKLLTTDDRVVDHALATQHDRLMLLPSGPIPPNPADLLSTGRIRKVIAEAAKDFDYVVIDGPPTLGLADAPLLAAAGGNVLFVVESGRTRTRAAIESLNRLDATGTHLLGAVLTKASQSIGYGYDGYGYGYGYGKRGRIKRTEILMIPHDTPSSTHDGH